MQLIGIGKTIFPSWAAAVTLIKDHGIDAAVHAKNAVTSGDGVARLDHAVLAMTNFDHAIDNTRKLPVDWVIPNVRTYYRGYEAAKQAVELLVGSGLIPGAKERVGRQSLVGAKEAFLAGVEAARTEKGRYAQFLGGGWLEATAEDATMAVKLLGSSSVGRELLAGINQVRSAVAQRRPLDDTLVKAVGDLFDRTRAEFDQVVPPAGATRPVTPNADVMAQTAKLLAEVEAAARVMVADAEKLGARQVG